MLFLIHFSDISTEKGLNPTYPIKKEIKNLRKVINVRKSMLVSWFLVLPS